MRYYFVITFLIVSSTSFCQVRNYDDCKFDRLFVELQQRASFGNDSTDIQKYFDSAFESNSITLTGKILIEVYVDTAGTPCCNSIIKIKEENIDFEEIKKLITSMPKWNPGFQDGYKVNSSRNIVLSTNNEKLKVSIK